MTTRNRTIAAVDAAEAIINTAGLTNTINPPVVTQAAATLSIADQIAALLASADSSVAREIAARFTAAAETLAVSETAAWAAKVTATVDAYVGACNEIACTDSTQLPADKMLVLLVSRSGVVAHEINTVAEGGAVGMIYNLGCIVKSDVRAAVDTAAWSAALTGYGKKKARTPRTVTTTDNALTPTAAKTVYSVDADGNFVVTVAHKALQDLAVAHHCKSDDCTTRIAGSKFDDTKRELAKHLKDNPSITNVVIK